MGGVENMMARAVRTNFSPGRVCGGYQLERILGQGGMGVVWQAWDSEKRQHVAIKVVAEGLLADPGISARFEDELRRHARLNHPNIVRLLDTFSVNDQQCMVMSLIHGESLAALLEHVPNHTLPLNLAIQIFTDILSALDYAHLNGILHRDIKPPNILLNSEQRAYVSDFGISIAIGEARRTRAGISVGTPEYMSPEQIRTPDRIDHRTDVYNAGCVLYAMLTGRPPFIVSKSESDTTAELALRSAHVKEMPVPPHQRQPTVPRGVSDLIMSALSKDPSQRPQGCAEFSQLLLAAVRHGTQAHAGHISTRPTLPLYAIFALVAIVAVILYAIFS
ncbi:MAG: serine/threonine-protein kinase [Nitrosospira sp.]